MRSSEKLSQSRGIGAANLRCLPALSVTIPVPAGSTVARRSVHSSPMKASDLRQASITSLRNQQMLDAAFWASYHVLRLKSGNTTGRELRAPD